MAGPSFAPVAGAIREAWDELRVHRLRVLLSLLGVALAVASLTAVVAIGEIQSQVVKEQTDRWGGREATIAINAGSTGVEPIDWNEWDAHVGRVFERYGFSHTTRSGQAQVPVQLANGVTPVTARLVDTAFGSIHRVVLSEGRWFVDEDAELLAPPVVISRAMWEGLGSPSLSTHPTITLGGPWEGTYQVIGVTPREGEWDTELRVDMLFDSYRDRVERLSPDVYIVYEVWVTAAEADKIGPLLGQDLRAGVREGIDVMVNRSDYAAQSFGDTSAIFTLITSAIAGIVLLLGGLSLVNIQLVAMHQRIREIGVRRSFGATGGRIFFSVLLESVVATVVAGIAGIIIVVVLTRQKFVVDWLAPGLTDVPLFPFNAALIGLVAAAGVGAIAGLIPAIVAVRVKPIDAIRF